LLRFAEWLDAVIEMFDRHAAVVIFHGRQQARQHYGRIRSPVAVMATVQFVRRAVGGKRDFRHAARAEYDLLPPALVHGAIADQPDVTAQQVAIPAENFREARRSRLLFALENELDVRMQWHAR